MAKNLFAKSALIQKAVNLLKENPSGITPRPLALQIFQIENVTDSLAEDLLNTLFKGDVRFRESNGRWFFRRSEYPMSARIAETTFVVLDVEIIGRGKSSKIGELAAFKVRAGVVQDEFYSLVNPGRPLSPGWFEPSRFAGEPLEQAPDASVVLKEFANFVDMAVLVAHNARFDSRVLDLEMSRLSHFRLAGPTIDTLSLFRKWLPGLDAYNLPQVAAYFSVDLPHHHRARSDALALSQIFIRLLQRLENRGIRTLEQLQDSFLPKENG